MNDSIFGMYCDIKKLLDKASKSEIGGAGEKELVSEWENAISVFDIMSKDYKARYERLLKNQSSFTPEQIDFICYQIGHWYLEWKDRLVLDLKKGTHRLGYAKEQLKTIICGE